MLSLVRAQACPQHVRRYAKVLRIPPSDKNSVTRELAPTLTVLERAGRVDVKPNHGLWHFFRRKEVDGQIKYETVETFEDAIRVTGRSWTAPELRRKSFSDLHTLWYVVLRERNLIATQKEEGRRMALPKQRAYFTDSKVYRCRKTMARIKYVLNERRLAYEGALRLLAEQKAEVESTVSAQNDERTMQKNIGPSKDGKTKRIKSRTVTSRAKAEESTKAHLEGKGDTAELAAASLFAPKTRSKDIHP